MLLITGTINGKVFNDEQITAKELMSVLGTEDKFNRLGKTIRFDIADSLKKEDKHPSQIAIMCETRCSHKGEQFQLTYCETRTRKLNKNREMVFELNPRKVYFDGTTKGVTVAEDYDLAVFLYLHQQNETSPVKPKGTKTRFKLVDTRALAEAQLKQTTTQMEIMNQINAGDIALLRLKAQGLKLGYMGEKTDVEVRAMLMNVFMKAVSTNTMGKFQEEFNSPYSYFQGLVIEATHKNIIIQETESGMYIYKWGYQTDNPGEIVCKVPREQEPMEHLIRFASNNYDTVLKTIEAALKKENGGTSIQEAVDRIVKGGAINAPTEDIKAKDMNTAQLIEYGVKYGAIELSRRDKSVFFLKGDEVEGDPIVTFESGKDIEAQFKSFLEVPANAEITKKLRGKIQGSQLALSRNSKTKEE